MSATIEGNLRITGDLSVAGTSPSQARSWLTQDNNAKYGVPLSSLVVWDSGAHLPTSAAADDLAVAAGTYGTDTLAISAGDLKAAGATTRRARFTFTLPPEYVAGETVTIRVDAGMKTTVADTSCTVDVEAFKRGTGAAVSGSDLVTTSATSINSLTSANKDFAVTSTALSPGDELDVRVSIACNDAATVTAVTPTIAGIAVLLDIKG